MQILVESKKIGDPLKLIHAGQLTRYFHVSNARVAVLTNGRRWDFYTDLDRPNIMDEQPFLRLDLMDIDPYALPELRKLTKDQFDLESVLAAAEELKYVSAIKRAVAEMFTSPPDDFTRLLVQRVYTGTITAKVRELFNGIVKKALAHFRGLPNRRTAGSHHRDPIVTSVPLCDVRIGPRHARRDGGLRRGA